MAWTRPLYSGFCRQGGTLPPPSEGGVPENARERFNPLSFTETVHTGINQQTNGDDCGVFAIMAMAAAARGDTPGANGTEWAFAATDVHRARAWMMQSMYLESVASGSCTHAGLSVL